MPRPAAKGGGHDRREPGCLPAGCRGGGAGAAGADGPDPGGPGRRPAAPPADATFTEYIPVVSAAVSAGTRRAYGSYWNRVLDQWRTRRLDEPTPSEIRQLTQISTQRIHPSRQPGVLSLPSESAQVSRLGPAGARRSRGHDLPVSASLIVQWHSRPQREAVPGISRDHNVHDCLSSLSVAADRPGVPVTAR